MIPILYYDKVDVEVEFLTTNGIGRLSDCISCICTEERNGIYEIEFQYPITGELFHQIRIGRIVGVIPSKDKTLQPFIIYRRSAELNGIVTFNAYHYSYLLSYSIMAHDTYEGIEALFSGFETDNYTYGIVPQFWFHTDKTNTESFTIKGLASVKSLLFGMEGSVIDVFGGGEYDYNRNHVYLYQHRGQDRKFSIRYGKNMTKLTDVIDASNIYSGVVAFWVDSETGYTKKSNIIFGQESIPWTDENDTIITDEVMVDINFVEGLGRVYILDVSDQYESQPTVAQLDAKAQAWLNKNTPWIPNHNINVDFVFLSQTEEYKNYRYLEDVRLCDTVHVIYDELGVAATAKVVKTEWNVLTDSYQNIELGTSVDDYKGYNGILKINGKTFRSVNGILINID